MSSDRFHKAAKDGLLDVLKEATRKDANAKDDDSMTPVLWAAFEGNLDALRLLCGRGGDPDKCDQFGNTALHLASAKGHLNCVDFLVKFGVNIYALDIDRHSAKDLAAINNRDNILRYLDSATATFEANNRKKAKTLRELAEKGCEKRLRDYMKRQQKLETEYVDTNKPSTFNNSCAGAGTIYGYSSSNKLNMLSTIKQKIWSSQGNLNKPIKETVGHSNFSSTKFSELVGSSSGGSIRSIASRAGTVEKQSRKPDCSGDDHLEGTGFKIGEIEADGTRTVTSLMGLQRDSEVLYVGTFSSNEESTKRGKISDVFEVNEANEIKRDTSRLGYGTLARSFSQPDFLADTNASPSGQLREELATQRSAGLFVRPMLGSIAFRRSVTAALTQLHPDSCSPDIDSNTNSVTPRKGGSMQKSHSSKPRSFLNISDSDSDGPEGYSEDEMDISGTPVQRFLAAWGLDEYLTIFQKQQIDLDTLMLLTESDLKSLGLPLGPFRKLTCAIQERRHALSNPGTMQDSRL